MCEPPRTMSPCTAASKCSKCGYNSADFFAILKLSPLAKWLAMVNSQSMAQILSGPGTRLPPHANQVSFHRTELAVIMPLYGRMVAAGEWRDYGISMLREVAVFEIYRRAAEHPLYKVEKRPALAKRQGQYAVIGMDGQVLKRGSDLKAVLRVLEKKLIRAVDS